MSDPHRSDDVERYAAAVRAALADASVVERADLLDDLESHLTEVAAESGTALAAALGPPEEYAAELRAAYEAGVRRPPPGPLTALRRGRRSRRLRAVFLGVLLVAVAGLFAGWQVVARQAPGVPWSYAQLEDWARAGQVRSVTVTGGDVVATDRAGARHEVVGAPKGERLAAAMVPAGVDVSFQPGTPMAGWLLVVILPNLVLLAVLAVLAGLGALLYVAVRRGGGRLSGGLPPR